MGIRCFLISTNTVTTPYAVHPLGIAHLSGALSQHGHEVMQFDVLAEPAAAVLAQRLLNFRPHLIGVSIRNIDTVDSGDPQFFLDDLSETLTDIRASSSAPIVVGGSGFSLFPQKIMALSGADYGITGEGEQSICDLADALERGKPPAAGTLLNGSPGGDGEWFPVAYDDGIADYYLKRGGTLNLQTKRGCPFQCDYCSYPLLEGRRYRYRDPEEVADEVRRLTSEHNARFVFFTDSVFNDLKGEYLKIAEAIIRQGNSTPWCAYFRPSRMERDALQTLKRSGLHSIEYGTDATSDATLEGMHKPFTMEEVFYTQKLTAELGIPSAHFVIFGGPEEDQHTFEEGLINMERLSDSVVFAFNGIRILPHAPIQKRAIAEGIIGADDDLLEPVFYFSPKIDRDYMKRRLEEEWTGRENRVFSVAGGFDQLEELHKMGFSGPLWDKLLPRQRPAERRISR